MKDNNKNKTNVPNLRFPGFEGDWESKKLGDVVDFKVTNSFSRENLNYEIGTVKNVHYGDIHTKFQTLFDVTKEQVPFVNENVFIGRISEDNYCKEGDIIFADASENLNDVGKSIEIVNLNNEKSLSGLHTILARPKENNFYKGFSGYLFLSNNVRLKIQKEAQGSKVLSISTGRLSNIELSFPTFNEQQKIATFLSLIDERINKSSKIIHQLKTLIRNLREKVFKQQIRFKDENGNDFSDWEVRKLGEIAKIFDGTHQTPNYVDNGISFFSVENVTANNFTNTKYVAKEIFESENKRVKIERGDILMTRIGDIGTARHIDWEVEASFYVSLALIKQNKHYNSEYLAHYIATDKFQSELWNRTIHVAFPKKINLGEIGECLVNVPCILEQACIANFLTAIAKKIETEKKILQQYKNQKAYLLQNMFV